MTVIASLLTATVLKGTVLLILLAALAAALRRSSASTRHLVWSLGLVGLLLLPALSLMPLRLAILPAAPAPSTSLESTIDPAAQTPAAASTPNPDSSYQPTELPRLGDAPGVFFGGDSSNAATGGVLPGLLQEIGSVGRPSGVAAVADVLLKAWLVGVAVLLGYLLLGAAVVRVIVRRGTPLRDYGWLRLLHDAQELLAVRAPVQLISSTALPMPVTAGILRPVIILPRGADGWDEERRWAVLLHELAHVQRRDLVSHLIARVACACYWFHPLVWYSAKRLRAESERACDDLVLTSGEAASAYADHLLQIVRAAGYSRTPAVAVPMAQRSEFEGRLLAILEPSVKRHRLSVATGLVITLLVALTALPLAALARASAPEAPPVQGEEPVVAAHHVDTAREPISITPGSEHEDDLRALDTAKYEDTPGLEELAAPVPVDDPDNGRGSQAAGGVEPLTVLVGALRDDDARVREAALQALDDLEDPRAVPALLDVIERYPGQRLAVLHVLDDFEDPRATPAVVGLLGDGDPRVRTAAADVLANMQDTTAIAALSRALRNDTDPQVRRAAARALGEIDDPRAVPALAEALARDQDLEVRKAVVWALGEIEDPSAIGALGPALQDANAEIRVLSARALGEIEDRRATPLLIPVLSDADAKVRAQALYALAEIEDPAAVEPIGALLGDDDVLVRRQAARALGNIEDARAVPLLIPAIDDADVEVREYVVWALGEIEDVRAVDALTAALADDHPDVRVRVVRSLGNIDHPSAAPGLRRALGDSNAEVRRHAASGLGDIDLTTAPTELVAALKDPDHQVRRYAAGALGDIEDPATASALTEAVSDENREVRLTALRALGELGTETSINALVRAMEDPDPEVRAIAARLLGKRSR